MTFDPFEEYAGGGEWPPITEWSTAKIADAYDVPAHLLAGGRVQICTVLPPGAHRAQPADVDDDAGFFPGEFMQAYLREAGLLWDYDPAKTIPLVDRRGSSPVKIGDGVIVHDEEGNAVFEGTVDRSLFDPSDYAHFSIASNPDGSPTWGIDANAPDPREGHWEDFRCKPSLIPITTTKEDTMKTKVKIKVNGPSIVTGGASALIEVSHDGPSIEPLERAVSTADVAARGMLEGIGMKPFEPDTVITREAGDKELTHEEFAEGHDTPQAPEERHPLPNPPRGDFDDQRRAMYSAVGTVAPNLIDLSKELAEAELGTEGSEGFRERMGRIGRTLAANADVLEQSRRLGERA